MDIAKKRERDARYKRERYKRAGVDWLPEDLEAVRTAAQLEEQPLAQWIRELCFARCRELGIQVPSKQAGADPDGEEE